MGDPHGIKRLHAHQDDDSEVIIGGGHPHIGCGGSPIDGNKGEEDDGLESDDSNNY